MVDGRLSVLSMGLTKLRLLFSTVISFSLKTGLRHPQPTRCAFQIETELPYDRPTIHLKQLEYLDNKSVLQVTQESHVSFFSLSTFFLADPEVNFVSLVAKGATQSTTPFPMSQHHESTHMLLKSFLLLAVRGHHEYGMHLDRHCNDHLSQQVV